MNNKYIKKMLSMLCVTAVCMTIGGCNNTEKEVVDKSKEQLNISPTVTVAPLTPETPTVTKAPQEVQVSSAVYNAENKSITAIVNGTVPMETRYLFKIVDADGKEMKVINQVIAASRYTFFLEEALDFDAVYAVSYKNKLTNVTMPLPYSTAEFEEEYTYEGNDLGAQWTEEETTFKVWAPTAKQVSVNLYKEGSNNGTPDDLLNTIEMSRLEQGVWYMKKDGNLNGVYYTYTVLTDDQLIETCDPYAKSTGVNGERAMILDMDSTDPEGWDKDVNPNKDLNITDSVIYELHLRDFTADADSGIKNKGKYLGLTETGTQNSDRKYTGLTYLTRLGVTHVHIMPMYDFGSVDETKEDGQEYNWGYDPVNYNVPEGSYSTDPYDGAVRVREVKEMVKALHDNGISVIMDVVYNHVYDSNKFAYNLLVPQYFSRTNGYGEYSNGSGCGNDNATERTMVKKYIVDSVNYWVDEYHIDGFRFDLAGLIDTETMNEVITTVHESHPDVIFYGEGWTMDSTLTKGGYKLANQTNIDYVDNFAMFSDYFRDNVRGTNGNLKDGGYVSGSVGNGMAIKNNVSGAPFWANNPTQVINYNACHDNNTLFDKIAIVNGYENFEENVRKNKFAAAVMFTSQGTPFMMSGEELLRTKLKEGIDPESTQIDANSFDSNSYKSGDKVNTIKWSTLSDETYKDMYEYYKGLIAFRKAHGGLRMTSSADVKKYITFAEDVPENITAFSISGAYPKEKSKGLYIIYNPTAEAVEMDIPTGDWKIFINSQYAGADSLGGARDMVTVEPYSVMALVKD